MNVTTTTQALPVRQPRTDPTGPYAVVDARADGRERIVGRFADLREANACVRALRAAGSLAARIRVLPPIEAGGGDAAA